MRFSLILIICLVSFLFKTNSSPVLSRVAVSSEIAVPSRSRRDDDEPSNPKPTETQGVIYEGL